jgi:hypothetical protein
MRAGLRAANHALWSRPRRARSTWRPLPRPLGTQAGPTARLAAFIRHIAAVRRKDVAIAAKRLDIVDTLEKLEAEAEALPDGIHHHFFLS